MDRRSDPAGVLQQAAHRHRQSQQRWARPSTRGQYGRPRRCATRWRAGCNQGKAAVQQPALAAPVPPPLAAPEPPLLAAPAPPPPPALAAPPAACTPSSPPTTAPAPPAAPAGPAPPPASH
eukprot:4796025-Prymnesium_polylepis.1